LKKGTGKLAFQMLQGKLLGEREVAESGRFPRFGATAGEPPKGSQETQGTISREKDMLGIKKIKSQTVGSGDPVLASGKKGCINDHQTKTVQVEYTKRKGGGENFKKKLEPVLTNDNVTTGGLKGKRILRPMQTFQKKSKKRLPDGETEIKPEGTAKGQTEADHC